MNNNLNEDITIAQQIVTREKLPPRHYYGDISGIYRFTNEVMSSKEYKDAITDKEKILSVLSSGDQIINSILLGSKEIEGFDISRFPKYYLMLKLAALKGLNKKEYLDFFFGNIQMNYLMKIHMLSYIRILVVMLLVFGIHYLIILSHVK